jgi:tetratricopeptide (TPR) repeat protein
MFGNFFSGLLLIILLPSLALSNTAGPSAAEETQFAFADHLLQNHDYFRAATEFKRLLFLYPSGIKTDEANYLLGTALYQTKSFKEAIIHWEGVLRQTPDTPFKEEIQYQSGRAYWELGQEDRAMFLWEKILQEGRSSQKPSAARALLWGLIKQKRFDPARLLLKKSPLTESEKEAQEGFFQKAENLPYKSATAAGTLAAIFPGAGHWYLDRKQDALIAFGVNALFTWAAVASFQQGNNGLGTLLSIIELAWYSGNIYSAINSAHKFNQKLDREFLEGYGLRFGLVSQGPSFSPIPYLVLQRAF